MKPVDQTVRGRFGNCFAACVASILELPVEEVPNPDPNEKEEFWTTWREWLERRNLSLAILQSKDFYLDAIPGYAVWGLQWAQHEDGHAVVAYNGKAIHDPCPGNRITSDNMLGASVEYATIFMVLDPTKGINAQSQTAN